MKVSELDELAAVGSQNTRNTKSDAIRILSFAISLSHYPRAAVISSILKDCGRNFGVDSEICETLVVS